MVHSRNVNNVANRKACKTKHTDCAPKRLREDEQCVQDLVTCLLFDPSSPTLRNLQSAMPASDELVEDFKSARAAGEEKLANFLRERVFSKNTSLHAPVPLSKRLTFAKMPVTRGNIPGRNSKLGLLKWSGML